jgi:N-acetylglucosamine-6-phosphate deacetylase
VSSTHAAAGRPGAGKTALTNVRVFDGQSLRPPGTVVIDGDRIGTGPAGAQIVDGAGGVLLPGLIDAHVHVRDRDTLDRLCGFGVTTVLDTALPVLHPGGLRP